MIWIAQSTVTGRIVGIYRNEDAAHDAWDYNDNVDIYWVDSDL